MLRQKPWVYLEKEKAIEEINQLPYLDFMALISRAISMVEMSRG